MRNCENCRETRPWLTIEDKPSRGRRLSSTLRLMFPGNKQIHNIQQKTKNIKTEAKEQAVPSKPKTVINQTPFF